MRPHALRGTYDGVRLTKETPGVLPVSGQAAGDDQRDLEVSPNLEGLVQDVVDGVSDLLVRDDVNVVKNADRARQLVDLAGILMHTLVHLDPLGLDLVQRFVGGEAG